jgi:hypothetical protein
MSILSVWFFDESQRVCLSSQRATVWVKLQTLNRLPETARILASGLYCLKV